MCVYSLAIHLNYWIQNKCLHVLHSWAKDTVHLCAIFFALLYLIFLFSGPSEHAEDIKYIIGKKNVSDDQKLFLIKNRKPGEAFKFPTRAYSDKRRASGQMFRSCLPSWLDTHEFLCYSKAHDGLYCLACVLFPMPAHHGQKANLLISAPYRNWKDAASDMKNHSVLEYHKDSMAKLRSFVETSENPERRIDMQTEKASRQKVHTNRKILTSIIRCVEFCGRQGLALRAHRDDGMPDDESKQLGNFKALLALTSKTDQILSDHFKSCALNATYISKNAQNDLLDCMRQYIQDEIVKQVKSQNSGEYFGIMADEVRDVSNWEQLGIALRYVKDGKPVEKLFSYVQCESITGEAIAEQIVHELNQVGLDPQWCRSQTYDGAGNMAGAQRGAAQKFIEIADNPKAPYFHCASHELNLVLSKACSVPDIRNMVGTMQSLGVFFMYSPTRQRQLEACVAECIERGMKMSKTKIKPLCETRWVERHTALEDLNELFPAILDTLEIIKDNETKKWGTKAVTEANGLFSTMVSSPFIVAFQSCKYIFAFTKPLSRLLQGTQMDILTAYQKLSLVKEEMQDIRKNMDSEYKIVFENCKKMADAADVVLGMPRVCSRQKYRGNIKSKDPEEHFKRNLFIPFVDNMISQMMERFGHVTSAAVKAILLLPKFVENLKEEDAEEVFQSYKDDMPDANSFPAELRLWKRQWKNEERKPESLTSVLNHPECKQAIFPNIVTVFSILLVTAVTSATVERANSTLKYIKNPYRNSMGQDRLVALVLLYIHRDIPIDYDKIVDMHANKNPRRMLFVNPCND